MHLKSSVILLMDWFNSENNFTFYELFIALTDFYHTINLLMIDCTRSIDVLELLYSYFQTSNNTTVLPCFSMHCSTVLIISFSLLSIACRCSGVTIGYKLSLFSEMSSTCDNGPLLTDWRIDHVLLRNLNETSLTIVVITISCYLQHCEIGARIDFSSWTGFPKLH